jgi:diguanylate cyclase (GGDEF)-like protein
MTDPTTPDHHGNSQNGARKDVPEIISPSSPTAEDGRRLGDDDQALADSDQTAADSDQTAADSDQTAADSDQTAADSDQTAADNDQAASDRDLGHGGDAEVHDSSREVRDRSAQQRHTSAQGRADAGNTRDKAAHARDLTATSRDQAADIHDRDRAGREASLAIDGSRLKIEELTRRAMETRRCAADDRVAAAETRARAALDRERAARDREQSARDRLQATAERDALMNQLTLAETDQLTGARMRAAGLLDLAHEIDRARRTGSPLVVAYLDVVGLKAVNDTHGHAAGDAMLQRAAHAVQAHLRSYDLIIRIGGDEFLCVMSGATIKDARARFRLIQASLAADADVCEIKVGFAALSAADSLAELISRADAELPTSVRR